MAAYCELYSNNLQYKCLAMKKENLAIDRFFSLRMCLRELFMLHKLLSVHMMFFYNKLYCTQ